MKVLLGAHESSLVHDSGEGHPESPRRYRAALRGARASELGADLIEFAPRRAATEELRRIHTARYLVELEERCTSGGGPLDPDTSVGPLSFEAAMRGAGAGIDAANRLRAGEAASAFLICRPPGHHALSERAMGFCLLNNVAITAAALVAEGERVMIVDFDAHHGNGTQAAFYLEPEVLYISLHQYPLYPGSGAVSEVGEGAGIGRTINLPFAALTAGDAYELAFDRVIAPAAQSFAPTWVLVSAGFDGHRDDPLTQLGLLAGDYVRLTQRLMDLSSPGRRIFFLEGGYDLEALERSVAATVATLGQQPYLGEPISGAGDDSLHGTEGASGRVVRYVAELHRQIRGEG